MLVTCYSELHCVPYVATVRWFADD